MKENKKFLKVAQLFSFSLLMFFLFFLLPFNFIGIDKPKINFVQEAEGQSFAGGCQSRLCKRARDIAKGIWSGFTSVGVGGVPTSLPGFGGNIVSAIPCSCPPGGVAFMLAPAPGSASGPYYFHPSISVLYPFSQLRPGAWVLGNAVPGGICGVFALHWCFPFPTEFTVTIPGVGTSL